jgi:hypothetical protein
MWLVSMAALPIDQPASHLPVRCVHVRGFRPPTYPLWSNGPKKIYQALLYIGVPSGGTHKEPRRLLLERQGCHARHKRVRLSIPNGQGRLTTALPHIQYRQAATFLVQTERSQQLSPGITCSVLYRGASGTAGRRRRCWGHASVRIGANVKVATRLESQLGQALTTNLNQTDQCRHGYFGAKAEIQRV